MVKWALALPFAVRREIIVSTHGEAALHRRPQPERAGASVFAKPEVWGEIARRVQAEGHTPVLPLSEV